MNLKNKVKFFTAFVLFLTVAFLPIQISSAAEEEYYNPILENAEIFSSDKSIDEIVDEIEFAHSHTDPLEIGLRAKAGTVWKKSTKKYDGKVGYYITTYTWISGKSAIKPTACSTKAWRKAILKKYGKVSSSYNYKMKTVQHIRGGSLQTQGYITDWCKATCYARSKK